MRFSCIFETHFHPAFGQKGKVPNVKCQIVPCVLEMGKCYFEGHGTSSAHGS